MYCTNIVLTCKLANCQANSGSFNNTLMFLAFHLREVVIFADCSLLKRVEEEEARIQRQGQKHHQVSAEMSVRDSYNAKLVLFF